MCEKTEDMIAAAIDAAEEICDPIAPEAPGGKPRRL
jgi:hypothetical protein